MSKKRVPLKDIAREAGVYVNTDNLESREDRLIDVLCERGVDGIINAAVTRNDPKFLELAKQGLLIVSLNQKVETADIPYVINDEESGIRLAMEHLIENGHKRIAHIAGPQNLSTGKLRLAAFQKLVEECGLALKDSSIARSEKYDEDEGYRCAQSLLNAEQKFTAFLCANDRLALGAISLLRSRGLECPKDISITGFNDISTLDLIPPRLTTIRVQQFEAGQACARILNQLIDQPRKAVPYETILPVRLVVRDSVAPLAHPLLDASESSIQTTSQ